MPEKRFFNIGGQRPCPYPGSPYPSGLVNPYPPVAPLPFPQGYPVPQLPFPQGYPNAYPGPLPFNPIGPYQSGFLPVPGYGLRSLNERASSGSMEKRLDNSKNMNISSEKDQHTN